MMRTRISGMGDWDQGQPSLLKKRSQLSGKYICDGTWTAAYLAREIGASGGLSWLWSQNILKTQRVAVTWGWQGAEEEQNSQLGCWWPECSGSRDAGLSAQIGHCSGRQNSCMCSWKASQPPWCPKLLPCHCQSSMSGNYLCSLARCPENCWTCLCCFQRTSNPMTSYSPVNRPSRAMYSFKIILYLLHHLFP